MTEKEQQQASVGCGCLVLIIGIAVTIWSYFATRTDLDGTFYRYNPETQIIQESEYVVFNGDNFKWYVNGKKTKDFQYEVYNGKRIKIEFGFSTLPFSMSEDKTIVTIDGKEFRKKKKESQ